MLINAASLHKGIALATGKVVVITLWYFFLMRNVNVHNRIWTIPENNKGLARPTAAEADKLNVVSEGCNSRIVSTDSHMFTEPFLLLKYKIPYFFSYYICWCTL